MPIAEFEEKQYEVPANIELGLQHAAVFAAGQVLEAVVGYDVAVHPPQNAPIWQLLGVNAPAGIQLVPNLWQRASVQPQAPQLPSTYVSLILQYKRPMRLVGPQAQQWHHWNAPYYRFPILQHQQDTLEVLENALAARAVVRYACPAYWTYAELQAHQHAHDVLANSAFVPPASLVGHQVWTYVAPGQNGWANIRGKEVPTETFGRSWKAVTRRGKGRKENLFDHLRGLAGGLGVAVITDNTSPTWLTAFAAQNHLSIVQRQAVFDTLELAAPIGNAGASWFVADLEILNP